MKRIAIYWDFENLHAAVCDHRNGSGWYGGSRLIRQTAVLDLDAVMNYVTTLGELCINKAYANWAQLSVYSHKLNLHAIELVQLFPRGAHSKNGADIRLALDLIDDADHHPHIDTFVLVGGDSDYIAVAQRLRQKGRRIIGIGERDSTSAFWVRSCNDFRFYASLLQEPDPVAPRPPAPSPALPPAEPVPTPPIPEPLPARVEPAPPAPIPESSPDSRRESARELLLKAMQRTCERAGSPEVLKAALATTLSRMDPSFNVRNLGFRSFAGFLESFSDLITVRVGPVDHVVKLRAPVEPEPPAQASEPPAADSSPQEPNHEETPAAPDQAPLNESPTATRYRTILRRSKLRLLDPKLLLPAIDETCSIFRVREFIETKAAFKDLLLANLQARGFTINETDINKYHSLLFRNRSFLTREESEGISLLPAISEPQALLESLIETVGNHIKQAIRGEPDPEIIAQILLGPAPDENSDDPVEIPEAPVEIPEAPVETPEAPVEIPEAPVETPEAPVEIPEAPVETPEAPVETPEAPVEIPEAPVEIPEAPVETPEAPVETPEAPVEIPEAPIESPDAQVAPPRRKRPARRSTPK